MQFRVSLAPLGVSKGGRPMLWGEDSDVGVGVRVYLPEGMTASNGAVTLTGTIEGVVPAKQEKKQSATGTSASALRKLLREELEKLLSEKQG